MFLSLHFPATCSPSRSVTLTNIGVPQYIGVPHRVTYPKVLNPAAVERRGNEIEVAQRIEAGARCWRNDDACDAQLGGVVHAPRAIPRDSPHIRRRRASHDGELEVGGMETPSTLRYLEGLGAFHQSKCSSQGQNRALTLLYMRDSLDSGRSTLNSPGVWV